jgi:hypothetical protein
MRDLLAAAFRFEHGQNSEEARDVALDKERSR